MQIDTNDCILSHAFVVRWDIVRSHLWLMAKGSLDANEGCWNMKSAYWLQISLGLGTTLHIAFLWKPWKLKCYLFHFLRQLFPRLLLTKTLLPRRCFIYFQDITLEFSLFFYLHFNKPLIGIAISVFKLPLSVIFVRL